MPVNFNDILNSDTSSFERPKLAPQGMYIFAVTGVPVQRDTKGADGTNFKVIEFPMRAVRAVEVEDTEKLAEYGDVKSVSVRNGFLINMDDQNLADQTLFRLRTFLEEHLGMGPGNLKQQLNNAVNKQCLGQLGYRPDKSNSEVLYHNLDKTAPLN